MCERKPLGRCASSIANQKASLTLKENKIKHKIRELHKTGTNEQVLHLVEQELAEVRLRKLKNNIDFYSSATGQEHFQNLQTKNHGLTEEENLKRLTGVSRKVWQTMLAKKLFHLEEASDNKTESLHNAAHSAKLTLSGLEYDLIAQQSLLMQNQQKLKNPTLPLADKQKFEKRIKKIKYDIIVVEMNIADTNAYLLDNHKRFESLIAGKIYRVEQHA